MQEKIISTSKAASRRYTSKEERQLHVENWKKSGLSMSAYCRQNNLPVASFSEWRSSAVKSDTHFKPIQAKASQSTTTNENTMVEIIVDEHIKVRLHHVRDATLVINIAQGLMLCSSQ